MQRQGIKDLLAFKADMAVLEPTRMNYSRIWIEHLIGHGVEIRLVDHQKLRYYRQHRLELPDKDDDALALALASYGFEFLNSPSRFVAIKHKLAENLRRFVLRLAHLNRVQSPIVNRIRQDLAWQFPEVALTRSVRTVKNNIPLLWGWLAQKRSSSRYDRLQANSIGLGITDTVRLHAERLCHLQLVSAQIERDIKLLLSHPNFIPYRPRVRAVRFWITNRGANLISNLPLLSLPRKWSANH